MHVEVGTSGYSYSAWKGKLYPSKLPAAAMLPYYAERFATVEINNTFYRMVAETTLEGWAAATPAAFTFALKAPRAITHERRLAGAQAPLSLFLERSRRLGEKRGPLLFQLPPFLRKDLPLLTDFLALLPTDCLAAFEFRHASWLDDGVYAALSARGAALCVADGEKVASPLLATSTWGYLRLRRPDYGPEDLRSWAERIQAERWDRCWVFFKHEDEARGPAFAQTFRDALA